MPDRRYRVLAVATHPVQYMTPIFRRMAEHPLLDFQVAYCSLRGAEAGHDPEFGADIQWDVHLLDGCSWTHVPTRGSGEVRLSLGVPGDRVTLRPYSVDEDWWMQQARQVHRSAVRGAWGA